MARAARSKSRDMAILTAVTEALHSAQDVRQALERTLALVADLLGLRTGWVWLQDPETGQFYSAAALNLPPYLQEPVRMMGKSCWCLSLFREGRLNPTNIDLIECSRLQPAVAANDEQATQGLRCHASIPLYFQDRPLGIMNLAAPAWREITPNELSLLSTIAHQIGIAIESARLSVERVRFTRAEERTRIAREIHDTLAQGLTAITLHIESALNRMEDDPARARERMERALAVARESLEEARRSVRDLRAPPLEGKPLPEALETLARAFTSETGIRVRLLAKDIRPIPERTETELFRIAQESLANVRRHSGASEVVLGLQTWKYSVCLSVHDNGKGFNHKAVTAGHHGLQGMEERASLLGGGLRVTSFPGWGTKIVALVPRLAKVAG